MVARALPSRLLAKMPEKRIQPRFGCDLVMTDDAQRSFRVENIGMRSMKYSGPAQSPGEARRFSLQLPNTAEPVTIVTRPVWWRRRSEGVWEYGARIEGAPEQVRRFDFVFHSMAERQQPNEVWWRTFELLGALGDMKQLFADLREAPLQGEVLRAAERLAAVSSRSEFMWRWAAEVLRRTTLSSVDPALRDECIAIKLLATVFFTIVDDVADEVRDRQLLHRILAQLLAGRVESASELGPERQAVLREFKALWQKIRGRVQRLPRYEEFAESFLFDAVTIVHSMTHSLLARPGPDAIGEDEVRFWNIQAAYMMVFADIDLMCSPGFDASELGAVRQIALAAQEMCAVANWLGTWEREVRSGDFSSGWVGFAVRLEILDPGVVDGGRSPDEVIEQIRRSDLEPCLLARWEKLWKAVVLRCGQIGSVNIEGYLESLEDFFRMQMAARGQL